MKKFLTILILIFSLQTPSQADDIQDFQIEGMSIGDSLLDYMSAEEIEKRKTYFYKSKEEFEAKGRWENYSPGRESHNFLLKPEVDLSFVEENPAFVQAMENLCGKGYQIFKKAIIRSVPSWAVPEWIDDYVKDNYVYGYC